MKQLTCLLVGFAMALAVINTDTYIPAHKIHAKPRTEPNNWPATYRLGTLTLRKCLEDSGIDGIYCHNFTTKLDFSHPADMRRIKVAFIVHIADLQRDLPRGAPRKVVFDPAGGPGAVSHMTAAHIFGEWMSNFPEVWASEDIIRIDQRGMGWSCDVHCWVAFTKHASLMKYNSPPDLNDHALDANAFMAECLAEIGTASFHYSDGCIVGSGLPTNIQRLSVIPYLGTKYAAADIEGFRIAAGYGKIDMRGVSYGATVVNTYAGMYPNNIRSILIDSPCDTTQGYADLTMRARRGRELCYDELANLCAGTPECAIDAGCLETDDFDACYEKTSALLNSAIDPSRWPITASYNWFDDLTGEVVTMNHTITIASFGRVVGACMALIPYRSVLTRVLIRIARGDRNIVMYANEPATANVNLNDIEKSLWMAELTGSIQESSYSFVIGRDYVFHFSNSSRQLILPSDREKDFALALGDLGELFAFTDLAWGSFASAFGDPISQKFTPELQLLKTPFPTRHNFPVFVVEPGIDSNCPAGDGLRFYERYRNIGYGPKGITKYFKCFGGEHGLTQAYFPDPGYAPIFLAIDNAIAHDIYPEEDMNYYQAMFPMLKYWPIIPPNSGTFDNILLNTEIELHSFPARTARFGPSSGCAYSGAMSWGVFRDDVTEEIQFYNCSLSDPRFTVSGTALFDWSSPYWWVIGPNFKYEFAVVTSGGVTRCFTYDHVGGMPPTQTEIPCN